MVRPALTDAEVAQFQEQVCIETLAIIREAGPDALSFRYLAERLQCSHTKVHRYYKDKEDLLEGVRDYAFGQFADALMDAQAPYSDSLEQLAACGEAYFEFGHTNPDCFGVLFANQRPIARGKSNNAERAWQAIRGPIAAAIAQEYLEGEPETIAQVFWSALHGVTMLNVKGWLRSEPQAVLDALAGGLARGHAGKKLQGLN